MIDFESLLKRYMEFIGDWEGSDGTFDLHPELGFSVEEIAHLRKVSPRYRALAEPQEKP